MPKKQEDTVYYKGSFMTQKKLPSLLALSMSLELILSPLPALAETNTQNAVNTAGQLFNLGMDGYNKLRGYQAQPQMPNDMAADMSNFTEQMTPTPDQYFTQENMNKIPGLREYIDKKNRDENQKGKSNVIDFNSLGCKTLPTTLTIADNQVCRDKAVNPLRGDPLAQANEANLYYKQYSEINTEYTSFMKRSNSGGQLFGDGCMKDAMQVLKGFFAYRVEQLGKVQTKLDQQIDLFESDSQSQTDLKSIRETTALLNGEDSRFAKEFKNTEVLDYGKRFADPACKSIFSKDGKEGAAKIGKKSGLLGIQEKLKNDFSATPTGSKYSPEQFIGKNADIIKDIQKMASDVGEQAKLNFSQISSGQGGYSDFLKGVSGSVSSESGANAALNPSFFADIQTKFAKTRNSLADQSKLISSEMGGKSDAAFNLLGNIENDSTFEAEVASLENGIKGDCVNKSGVDEAISRIYDPTLSKQANKQSSELIKKKINKVISDVTLSPERKLAELKSIQSQSGNRYQVRMDSDYETQEMGADGKLVKKNVSASSRVSPESYFSDIIKNCDSQYQVNKLKNKLSGKEAVQQLRTLKQDYKKAAAQNSQDIKNEIIKKMIDCNGNSAVASGSEVGSCTPEKLNMSNPGFCAKAAFNCSANMQKCTDKAEKFVQELKGDRLTRTNRHNDRVEKVRQDMVAIFDGALAEFGKEGETLRGMFGAGFVDPENLSRDIKGDDKFDPKFLSNDPDALEIKDPRKYLDMVRDNLTKLKKQIQNQSDEIMAKDGPLAQHIEETMKNHKEVADKAQELAANCMMASKSYDALVKQQADDKLKSQMDAQKANSELGEKNGELCGAYADIMSDNPNGACKEDIRDLANASIKASSKAGQTNTTQIDNMVKEMNARCAGMGKESKDVAAICTSDLINEDFKAFFKTKYNKLDSAVSGDWDDACQVATKDQELDAKSKWCKDGKKTFATREMQTTTVPHPTSDELIAEAGAGETCSLKSTSGLYDTEKKQYTWKISCESTSDAVCSKVTTNIIAIYNEGLSIGKLNSETQSNSMPSLCSSNNNAGPYNTKGSLPFTDPMSGANNGNGVMGY